MKVSRERRGLAAVLRAKLSPFEWALLRGDVPATEPGGYDAAFAKVRERLPGLEAQVSEKREKVRDCYSRLEELPQGSRRTLLENSPPLLLLVLAHRLMERSYGKRFTDVRRSLQLAELALEATELVKATGYLAPYVAADLEAEALIHLGNARRINSDLTGAEDLLVKAEECRKSGTRDRGLRADMLRHLACLRFSQGRAREAGNLTDREIAIRRHLGDEERLGEAFIGRGIISTWFEPLSTACTFLRAGVERLKDPKIQLLALLSLSETLARKGDGFEAWKVVCQADRALAKVGGEAFRVRTRHIKGIALRVLGQLEGAERELTAVRDEYLAQGRPLQVAIASLDLACVCAAQGSVQRVKTLATEALAILSRERVEDGILRAVLTLQQAAEAERMSERLAVEAANCIVHARQNPGGRAARQA